MAERRPIVLIGNTLHELPAGDTVAGLAEYYNKSEIDLKLQNVAVEAIDVNAVIYQLDLYSKVDINTMLSLKADADNVYSKSDMLSILTKKANLTDVYTKSETYNRTQTYSRAETYARTELYSKEEMDAKFLNFGALTTNDVYTKVNMDTILAGYVKKTEAVTTTTLTNEIDSLKSQINLTYLTKADGITTNYLSTNGYMTQAQADLRYAQISGTASYVTQTTFDTKMALKANVADVYTKAQIDAQFGTVNYYTKDEVFSKTQITSMYYNQTYVNDALASVNSKLTTLQTQVNNISITGTGTSSTFNPDLYYNKDTIDIKLSNMATTTMLSGYVLASNVYTKDMTYDRSVLYTNSQVDTTITNAITTAKASYYTKTEVDTKLANVTIDTSALATKAELNSVVPVLKEIDTITVSSSATKTYNVTYNAKFVQVFVNRKVLYKEEFNATNGTSITLNIDLIEGDKIKVFTI